MSYLLHGLLSSAAETHPNALALVDDEREITYSELNALSNQIAHLLSDIGVQKGDRVGLYLRKSLEAVAGAYGIMKAGAAYVPLDPEAPVDRIAYIVTNCDIHVLLTAAEKVGESAGVARSSPLDSIVFLDREPDPSNGIEGASLFALGDVATRPRAEPMARSIDLDLALLLYTSGSTGHPKGVMLSHLNVMTFVKWAVSEYGVTDNDRLSQIAPLHFDLSTFDLYGAALAGASVHLAPRQTSMFPMEMRRFLEKHRITVMYAVPSALSMLTEKAKLEPGDLPDLKTILFAGEVFPTKYLSRLMGLLPHAVFANLYGPTETNVCTAYRVSTRPEEDDPPISIGKAITNVETFVVQDDGTVAAPGEVGELHVRGPSVMQGYWGDPERTAKVLFHQERFPGPADRVYKTGDLVIEDEDGNYTFLGRRDNQIKSRGYRIELGEIESALYTHPDVRECAAIAIPDEMVTNRIKAYVVAVGDLETRDLTKFVSQQLPKYMVPGEFEFRQALPKTSTGKIDRQALMASAQTEGER